MFTFLQVYGHLEDEPNVRLLRDDDVEGHVGVSFGPPSFVSQSEALQYQMARVEAKVEQLHEMHSKHLRRPTFDEVSQEEEEIKRLTSEITQVCLKKGGFFSERFYLLVLKKIHLPFCNKLSAQDQKFPLNLNFDALL